MKTTLILITSGEVHRFDLAGRRSPRLLEHWRGVRPPGGELVSAIDVGLRQGPRRAGAQVYVLAADFWCGPVQLSSDVVQQVSREELPFTLAFEAEAFSGVSGLETTVVFRELAPQAGEHRYWVTQIPHADLTGAEMIVRQWGGRLRGLSHPASAHTPAPAPAGAWGRLEIYREVCLLAYGHGARVDQVELVGGDPQSATVQRELLQLTAQRSEVPLEALAETEDLAGIVESTPALGVNLEAAPEANWPMAQEAGREAVLQNLTASGAVLPPVAVVRSETFGSRQAPERWAVSWLAGQLAKPPAAPLAIPPKRPASAQTRTAIAAAVALLALLGCSLHHRLVKQQVEALTAQRDKMTANSQEYTRLTADALKQEKERERQRAARDRLADDLALARRIEACHRGRVVQLLQALSELSTRDLVLREIASSPQATTIKGVCLNNAACDHFAHRLRARLELHSWRVAPARVQLAENQLYEFELELTEAAVRANPVKADSLEADSLEADSLEASPVKASPVEASPVEAMKVEAAGPRDAPPNINGRSQTLAGRQ